MSVIETSYLTKQYNDVVAVDSLDLEVQEEEVFGFLGPNGAGKTTTINLLLHFVEPTAGSARILGRDIRSESTVIRRQVGVLPEGYSLYDRLTGRRHLEFAINWKDAADDPDSLLARVGLDSDDADRPVGDYSKGMQQRLAMATALVGDPELLILDEPSSGLDPNGIRLMREIVREEAANGTAVFFSSHILGQVEAVCDRVGILNAGRLVAVDTVDGLREAAGIGSTLQLRLADSPSIDLIDIGGVEGVTHEDGLLAVSCTDPRAKAQVITRLTNAGIEILDVTSDEVSLEDIFAAYTADEFGATTDRAASGTEEVVI